MIDPGPQLAIDEQLLTQQGDQIGQAPPEAGAELEIFEQKQGNERGPYLNLQGVGAGADKGFDAQVLFEGLEKQLDLPAAFVDLGDGGGGEMTMIGEKDQGALVLLIPDLDAAREQVALLAAQLVEEDKRPSNSTYLTTMLASAFCRFVGLRVALSSQGVTENCQAVPFSVSLIASS
jgi:hypothetical protein